MVLGQQVRGNCANWVPSIKINSLFAAFKQFVTQTTISLLTISTRHLGRQPNVDFFLHMFSISNNTIKHMATSFDIIVMQNLKWPP